MCENESITKQILDVHPNLKVNNIKNLDKSKIETSCIVCGKINTQRFNVLINSQGCSFCRRNSIREVSILNFKNKLKLKFGDIYNYNFTNYLKDHNNTNIEIICAKHGTKIIDVYKLLNSKHGCPGCGKESSFTFSPVSHLEKTPHKAKLPGIFYKLKFTHLETNLQFMKIGITKNSIKERFRKKEYDIFDIEIIEIINGTMLEVAILERDYKLLNKLNKFYIPKSITFDGHTECYFLDEEIQLMQKTIPILRESLILKQKNICPICELTLKKPVIDHEHKKRIKGSGKIRQVICSSCNIFIAKLENNVKRYGFILDDLPRLLGNMMLYHDDLNKLNLIHPSEKPKKLKMSKRNYNKLKKIYVGRAKFPEFPKSGHLNKKLESLFTKFEIEPYN